VASPVRFAVVKKMLEARGFFLHHTSGSHFVFKSAAGRRFVVPVHQNQVKGAYVKQIEKLA
jgi:predicted RNA binding protein YcfA (HicA-like mRNA interferase family)